MPCGRKAHSLPQEEHFVPPPPPPELPFGHRPFCEGSGSSGLAFPEQIHSPSVWALPAGSAPCSFSVEAVPLPG